MAGAGELLCGGESGGARADDGDACRCGWGYSGAGSNLPESAFDVLEFDVADEYRLVVDAEGAGGLARGGADAAGDFRGSCWLSGGFRRPAPLVAVDEFVELGDTVLERAADAVAEGMPQSMQRAACLARRPATAWIQFVEVMYAFVDGPVAESPAL